MRVDVLRVDPGEVEVLVGALAADEPVEGLVDVPGVVLVPDPVGEDGTADDDPERVVARDVDGGRELRDASPVLPVPVGASLMVGAGRGGGRSCVDTAVMPAAAAAADAATTATFVASVVAMARRHTAAARRRGRGCGAACRNAVIVAASSSLGGGPAGARAASMTRRTGSSADAAPAVPSSVDSATASSRSGARPNRFGGLTAGPRPPRRGAHRADAGHGGTRPVPRRRSCSAPDRRASRPGRPPRAA